MGIGLWVTGIGKCCGLWPLVHTSHPSWSPFQFMPNPWSFKSVIRTQYSVLDPAFFPYLPVFCTSRRSICIFALLHLSLPFPLANYTPAHQSPRALCNPNSVLCTPLGQHAVLPLPFPNQSPCEGSAFALTSLDASGRSSGPWRFLPQSTHSPAWLRPSSDQRRRLRTYRGALK